MAAGTIAILGTDDFAVIATSDLGHFWLLQIVVVAFALLAALQNGRAKHRAGRGAGVTLSVSRGPHSMEIFFGAYAGISAVLVALSLTVDGVAHRVFWVLFDTIIVAYLCIYNPWSRNWLLSHVDEISKRETR